jgi:hypothetical protein
VPLPTGCHVVPFCHSKGFKGVHQGANDFCLNRNCRLIEFEFCWWNVSFGTLLMIEVDCSLQQHSSPRTTERISFLVPLPTGCNLVPFWFECGLK